MEVRKSLEKKTLILGIEIRDLGISLGLFFGIMILINIVRIILPISVWYNIAGIVVIGVYVAVVKYGLKNKHPSFIVSLLSFHFYQPKRIWMKKLDFIEKHKKSNGKQRQKH